LARDFNLHRYLIKTSDLFSKKKKKERKKEPKKKIEIMSKFLYLSHRKSIECEYSGNTQRA